MDASNPPSVFRQYCCGIVVSSLKFRMMAVPSSATALSYAKTSKKSRPLTKVSHITPVMSRLLFRSRILTIIGRSGSGSGSYFFQAAGLFSGLYSGLSLHWYVRELWTPLTQFQNRISSDLFLWGLGEGADSDPKISEQDLIRIWKFWDPLITVSRVAILTLLSGRCTCVSGTSGKTCAHIDGCYPRPMREILLSKQNFAEN